MQLSIQTNSIYSDLLGDSELADILSAANEIRAMIDVEVALACAQSAIGMIPDTVGAEMEAALKQVEPDSLALSQGVTGSGVPVPALLSELRKKLPPPLTQWLHWGATSQDIVDTAMMLQMARCLEVFDGRLSRLLDTLQNQSRVHATTLMAARTRTQLATPITLGLRIAQWAQPLIRLEGELRTLKQHDLKLQLGGAVGSNTVLSPHGPAITAHMANSLKLLDCTSWHTDRSSIVSLSNWLMQLCLYLKKFAKDLLIMSRTDISELQAGSVGGSSTMPHKANPIQTEMVVAMSTIAQALHAGICAAASPIEERDGTSWTVEWVMLPQLIVSTGCAIRHSLALAETLIVKTKRIQSTVDNNTQLMAEAASFALADHMSRDEAQALVKRAAQSNLPLSDALAQLCDLSIDWDNALDPKLVCAPCTELGERIFSTRSER